MPTFPGCAVVSMRPLIVGEDEIHVIDLKTGQHPVASADNPQLLAYALGAAANFDGFEKQIYVHIWQGGKGDESHVSLLDLNAFADTLMDISELALKEGAPRNPSDDACRYCKAAPECPALHQQQLEIVGGDFADLTAPDKLTDEQIATVVLNRSSGRAMDEKGVVYTRSSVRSVVSPSPAPKLSR